jgi:hypothetical protein
VFGHTLVTSFIKESALVTIAPVISSHPMKLLVLALLFFTLAVSTSASKFFKFDEEDIKNGSPDGKQKLRELEEKVNKKLEELAAKDPKLELEFKRFFDFFLDYFLSYRRANDVYEKSKLDIAHDTIRAFLKLKLAPFDMDKDFFVNLCNMYFYYESLSSKGDSHVDKTAIVNFLRDTVQKNQTEFTKEEREILSYDNLQYNFHLYLIFQYAMSLDKEQYIKIFFHNGFPQSPEKPLCLSDEDFNLILKKVSKEILSIVKIFFARDQKSSELLEASILPKLYKLALPGIKTFKWLNVPPVPSNSDPSDIKSKPNPSDNNSNKGLFDGKEKIFAVCAIVLIIAVLVGGFAFWHLRLRKKALIAPISG